MSADPYSRYLDDPASFMRDVTHFEPWSMQVQIAEAVRDYDRVAVRSCNAMGKTATAAETTLWWLGGGPGSIVITTSMTERQVRKVLWREIHQRFKPARGFFRGAQLTDTELLLGPSWFASGFSTDETESFQGFHGARVLVIVDEASGVPESIFEAVEGLLAGGDAKLLLISNPLRTSGTFYDAFTKDREQWKTITISAFDTPNFTGEKVSREASKRLVSQRWVERLAKKRGIDSNEYRVRVLGEFAHESEDTVCGLGDLERARSQNLEPGFPLVVGVDVARFGSDATVIAVRRGNVIRVARSYNGRDLMVTSGEVLEVARSLEREHGRKPTLVIDDVGVGGGLTDRLRELNEFRVVDFNGGRKARSRDYPNKRSEIWFQFAELLPVLDLDPADEELAADLLAPTYALSSDAKRVVEQKSNTKKRLRRSPDRADAVMLTCVVEPPTRSGRLARRKRVTSVPRGRLPGHESATQRAERIRGRVLRPRPRAAPLAPRVDSPAFEARLRRLGVPVYDADTAAAELALYVERGNA